LAPGKGLKNYFSITSEKREEFDPPCLNDIGRLLGYRSANQHTDLLTRQDLHNLVETPGIKNLMSSGHYLFPHNLGNQ